MEEGARLSALKVLVGVKKIGLAAEKLKITYLSLDGRNASV